MQTPETRVIHQCTYTPIQIPQDQKSQVPANNGSQGARIIPEKPWLKKKILLTALPEPKAGKLVLQHLQEMNGSALPACSYDLAEALRMAWAGDVLGSVQLLRAAPMEDVVCFIRLSLEAEKDLLQRVRRDADASVERIRERLKKETETNRQLHKEISAVRESILSEVQNMLTPLLKGQVQPVQAGGGSASPTASLSGPARPTAGQAEVAGFSMVNIPASMPVITPEMLRTEMLKEAPLSAAYLDMVGVFASPAAPGGLATPFRALEAQNGMSNWKEKMGMALFHTMPVEPMGYLHLERLQFTPLGYERGELVYSLPMLPGETVRLSHREWSRTETEYSKLVSTEMETAAEEAISEKSELTQSTSTQQQHSSAYNAAVNAGYSGAGFNISASFGYDCNNSESSSRQFAAKQAQEITKKASSRAKKDSKISFKVTTMYETEEQSFRELTNTTGRAIRYDFHRLMKKWRIDLYRYDVRMTYDIVIPEPGSYLQRKYVELRDLEAQLAKPYQLCFTPSDIEAGKLDELSQKYGISLENPPAEFYYHSFPHQVTYTKNLQDEGYFEIVLPEGYEFITWSGQDGSYQREFWDSDHHYQGMVHGNVYCEQNVNDQRLFAGSMHSSQYNWYYRCNWRTACVSPMDYPQGGETMSFAVYISARRTDAAYRAWQLKCYQQLADADHVQFELERERLAKKCDTLRAELDREDALALRKIEKEELMKGVLRWLFGPDFDLYPADWLKLPDDISLSATGDLPYYDEKTHSVKPEYLDAGLRYGEMIKFLHQAIEWESLNYVLYPYFWTAQNEERLDFKQMLFHTDYVHRSFLRAGAARVVLTIRPGYEKAFLSFMSGQFGAPLNSDHYYMTVADELKAMAMTKYPYTPDANVEKGELLFIWEQVPGTSKYPGTIEETVTEHLLDYLESERYVSWAYKFFLPTDFADDLDSESIDPDLVDAFKTHGYPLPSPAKVVVKRAKQCWTITDDQGKKIFFIENTGQTLDVFDRTQRPEPVHSVNDDAIRISLGNETVEITREMNPSNGTAKALLKATNGRTLDLVIREEANQRRVYKAQNWVDTWYEFTPTGALDIVVGNQSEILVEDETEYAEA